MPFKFYDAPNAPAPDWGATIQAHLASKQRAQAALRMLAETVQEQQRMKLAEKTHAENKRIDEAKIAVSTRGNELEARRLDQQERSNEDVQTRFDAEQERLGNSRILDRFADIMRTRMEQQGANQRAEMAAKRAADIEAEKKAKEAERQANLKGYTTSLTQARRAFEPHDFTAGDVLIPGFSTDPSAARRAIMNAVSGATPEEKQQAADDLMKQLQSRKVSIAAAPPNWYDPIGEQWGGKVDPRDANEIASMVFGVKDPSEIPGDVSAAEAQARKYFLELPQFKGLAAGMERKSADPTEAARKEESLRLREEAAQRSALESATRRAATKAGRFNWDTMWSDKQRQDAIDAEMANTPGAPGAQAPAPAPKSEAPPASDEDKLLQDVEDLLNPK